MGITRTYDIHAGFAIANGVWRYLGTIVTTKSNFDTTTPFCNDTATLTFATVVATNTIVVTPKDGGRIVTLTGVNGAPANENQFQADAGTDTQDAAAFVTAWNAHSVLSGYALASSSGAVVTLTARPGCPLLTITQGSGATITIARGGLFGQTLGGKTLLIQAAADTRVGWGVSSAAAITEADATNGFLLAADRERLCQPPERISHLASTGGSLRVYENL